MRILQLNVWTGRVKGALADFLKDNEFDVICLQEAIWGENKLLGNFALTTDQIKDICGLKYEYRSPNWFIEVFGSKMQQGNVILSKEKIIEKRTEVTAGNYLELKELEDTKKQGYTLQIVKLANGLNVVNHHGYWLPTPLGDENTVRSMRKAASFIRNLTGPVVMCGDLNVVHASPAMRELEFLRDLTNEYHVDNTLSGLKFNGKVACDHILVNDDVIVENFRVLDDLVSDHKPLSAKIKF